MIEQTVLDYLSQKLNVKAYMEKPQKPPKKYVIIERTSGRRRNFINEVTFAIQSYGESLFDACLLNEQVKNAMIGDGTTSFGIASETDISKCSLNTDYNYTDTQTKSYRYQAVYDLVF